MTDTDCDLVNYVDAEGDDLFNNFSGGKITIVPQLSISGAGLRNKLGNSLNPKHVL
jgi:hypothetical protein